MARPQLRGVLPRPELHPEPAPGCDPRRVRAALEAVCPGRVRTDPADLLSYSYDATGERFWPDAVVFPETADEVAATVRAAAELGLPVIARGAGTNLSGGTLPLTGGVIVCLTRMNRVAVVDPAHRLLEAEPGATNLSLEGLLAPDHFYPPDPASQKVSTIGGNIAENAGGPHAVKYGVTGHWVADLDLVDARGRLWTISRSGFVQSRYDLVALVTGSEGTLGIVTRATLRYAQRPQTTLTLLASFADLKAAISTAAHLVARNLEPSTLELMDRETLHAVEAFVAAGYPLAAEAVLLVELDGPPAVVERRLVEARRLLFEGGAIDLREARAPAERDGLWRGRRAAYGAVARLSARIWTQDVTVPRPQLPAMIEAVVTIARRHGLKIATVAHAGDGNLHPDFAFDPGDADEVERVRSADQEILAQCVQLGGSITGEHGVGIDKRERLALMFRPEELQRMEAVRAAFDPDGRLNPFKATLPPREEPPAPSLPPAPARAPRVDTTPAVAHAVLAARTSGERVRVGRRPGSSLVLDPDAGPFDLDPGNLTVSAWAGMTLGELERRLAAAGLEFPFTSAHPDRTLGGLVGLNLPGFDSLRAGALRQWLLAARWVAGDGVALHFGRPTMKNVAGYRLDALMVGARGTLGVMTEATVRLRPAPPLRTWVRGRLSPGVLERVLALEPAGVHLVNRGEDVALWVLFEGEPESVEPGARALAGEGGFEEDGPKAPVELVGAVRAALGGRRRLRLAPAPADLHLLVDAAREAGPAWVDLGAGVGHFGGDPAPGEALERAVASARSAARAGRGAFVEEREGVLAAERGPDDELMARLRRVFDPDGVFDPGPWEVEP